MNWRLIAAIAIAGTIGSFTDWLFMGVLFHERYNRYPEVWWPGLRQKAGDVRAIVIASALGYVTSAAVILLCLVTGSTSPEGVLSVVVLAWIAGPLVMQVTNGFWIKFDPLLTLSHSIGYLVRFLIAGAAAWIALS
jgi:hypothetical protein